MEPDKRAQECGKHELWQWRLRLAMSRGRHQTCGYLMAVDDTCHLQPPRSGDSAAAVRVGHCK